MSRLLYSWQPRGVSRPAAHGSAGSLTGAEDRKDAEERAQVHPRARAPDWLRGLRAVTPGAGVARPVGKDLEPVLHSCLYSRPSLPDQTLSWWRYAVTKCWLQKGSSASQTPPLWVCVPLPGLAQGLGAKSWKVPG